MIDKRRLQSSNHTTNALTFVGFCMMTLACVTALEGAPATASESEQQAQNVGDALAEYSRGWTARDTDAILARHADDTSFHLVMHGSEIVTERADVRATFDAIFASNPNYKSTIRTVRLGNDFAVVEYDFAVDPMLPARAGAMEFTPSGQSYTVPAVDIIVFKNGLVTQKITYLDTETIRANSAKVEEIQQ